MLPNVYILCFTMSERNNTWCDIVQLEKKVKPVMQSPYHVLILR
jgi:hypothetical protein